MLVHEGAGILGGAPAPNEREPVTGVAGSRSDKKWRRLPLTRTQHKPLNCTFAYKSLLRTDDRSADQSRSRHGASPTDRRLSTSG
jgi:hypothetical protein